MFERSDEAFPKNSLRQGLDRCMTHPQPPSSKISQALRVVSGLLLTRIVVIVALTNGGQELVCIQLQLYNWHGPTLRS